MAGAVETAAVGADEVLPELEHPTASPANAKPSAMLAIRLFMRIPPVFCVTRGAECQVDADQAKLAVKMSIAS